MTNYQLFKKILNLSEIVVRMEYNEMECSNNNYNIKIDNESITSENNLFTYLLARFKIIECDGGNFEEKVRYYQLNNAFIRFDNNIRYIDLNMIINTINEFKMVVDLEDYKNVLEVVNKVKTIEIRKSKLIKIKNGKEDERNDR